jgi:hypothetical protein
LFFYPQVKLAGFIEILLPIFFKCLSASGQAFGVFIGYPSSKGRKPTKKELDVAKKDAL